VRVRPRAALPVRWPVVDAGGEDRAGGRRWPVPVAVALLLIPLVVSAITLLARPSLSPIRDGALMELQVRNIGHHAVNLGLYSRDGWSHPGALVFYSLVLPYRIVGGTAGLLVGALVINGIAIVGVVLVARRLGGERAALGSALALGVLAHAYGPVLIRDPWVCSVTTLPFGFFLVSVWAMVERRSWALPLSAFLASWLTQTHVGFAPLTIPLVGAGAVVLALRVWRDRDHAVRRRLGGAVAVAVGILAVVWAPVAWDQVRGRGNLGVMVRWFEHPNEPVHTVTEGARVVLGAFAFPPDFVTGHRRIANFTGETLLRHEWHLPVLLLVVAAAVVVAWRRHDRPTVRLAGVLAVTVGLSVVAVARTVGIMYEYRLLWTWTIAALSCALAFWTFWAALAQRWPRTDPVVAVGIIVVLVGLGTAQIVDSVRSHRYDQWNSAVTARVTDQLARRFAGARGAVVLRAPTPASAWYMSGVLLGLQKRGIDARVQGESSGMYAGSGVHRGDRVAAELDVLAAGDLMRLPGARPAGVVAYSGHRTLPRQLAVLRDAARKARGIDADFAAGRIDQEELARRLLALDRRPQAVAVVTRGR
jgi:hypothetical protein